MESKFIYNESTLSPIELARQRNIIEDYEKIKSLGESVDTLSIGILPVGDKRRHEDSYRRHFVPVLHEVMVHSTLLPKCPHDSTTSLEC